MNSEGQPLRVLIADDSSVVRERLITLLNDVPGVSVVGEAQDVQDTMDALNLHRPEILILDLGMPGGSGLDVLGKMEKQSLASTVIVLTNYAYPEYEREAMRRGASAFLNKSTEFLKVADLLRDLAEKSKGKTCDSPKSAADGEVSRSEDKLFTNRRANNETR